MKGIPNRWKTVVEDLLEDQSYCQTRQNSWEEEPCTEEGLTFDFRVQDTRNEDPKCNLTNHHGNGDDRGKSNRIHEFWIHEEEFKVVQADKLVVIRQTCPVGKTVKGSLQHRHIEENCL